MMEFERPSPKLLIIGFGFLVSTLAFALALGRTLSSLTLSKEALLGALPVLLLLFLTASLMIIFALLTERKVLALGILVATILLVLPFAFLPLLWRLIVVVVSFLGFLLFASQARGTHEAYTGFSASYYRGAMRNFFLLFVFILGIVLFFSTSQALERQKFEIPEETLKPVVGQFVGIIEGMMRQQPDKSVPESELALAAEDVLTDLLGQVGLKLKLKGEPKSFAQVTTRITKALKPELAEIIAPFKIYIPFLIAGMAVLTLFSFIPFVGLVGAPIFFIVYRFLILVRVLKFEEVERTVKRLALA